MPQSVVISDTRNSSPTNGDTPSLLSGVSGGIFQRLLAEALNKVAREEAGLKKDLETALILSFNRAISLLPGSLNAEAVANVTRTGEELTPLHLLAWDKQPVRAAKLLLSSNADSNALGKVVDESGGLLWCSPFHLSAWVGNEKLFSTLLAKQAFVDTKDAQGRTAFYWATEKRQDPSIADLPTTWRVIAERLLRAGADCNALASDGSNPLSRALYRNDSEVIEFLCKHEASLSGVSLQEWQRVVAQWQARLTELIKNKDWDSFSQQLSLLAHCRKAVGDQGVLDVLNTVRKEHSPNIWLRSVEAQAPVSVLEQLKSLGAQTDACCSIFLKKGKTQILETHVNAVHLAAFNHDLETLAFLKQTPVNFHAVSGRGDSALFFALHDEMLAELAADTITRDEYLASQQKRFATVKALSDSTDLRKTNYDGRTASDICLLKALWAELAELSTVGGALRSVTPEEMEQAQKILADGLFTLATQKAWESAHKALTALERVPEFQDSAFIPELCSRSHIFQNIEGSLMVAMLRMGAPENVLDKLQELGVSYEPAQTVVHFPKRSLPLGRKPISQMQRVAPEAEITQARVTNALPHAELAKNKVVTDFIFPDSEQGVTSMSPLAVALLSGNPKTVAWVQNNYNCKDFSSVGRDSAGLPLSFYAASAPSVLSRIRMLTMLKDAGVSAWQRTHQDITLYDFLLAQGDWQTARAFKDWFAQRPENPAEAEGAYSQFSVLSEPERAKVFSQFAESLVLQPSLLHKRAFRELRRTANIDVAHAITEGIHEALNPTPESTGKDLARLMPAILTGEIGVDVLQPLIQGLTSPMMVQWIRKHGHNHPNLAELMAILSIKDRKILPDDHFKQIAYAISRVFEVFPLGTSVPGAVAELWGDLAAEGFTFSFFKQLTRAYDDQPTLLKKIGLQPLVDDDVPSLYGAGYLASKEELPYASLDDQTRIILRRGFYLISHPSHGTIIKRNSSPLYGRDDMPYSVMYSLGGVDSAFTLEQLTQITPEFMQRHFASILSPELNEAKLQKTDDMRFLFDEWKKFRAYCSQCMFDTDADTAWTREQDAPPVLVGGVHSRAFSAVIDHVERLYTYNSKHASLAFCDPARSVWNLYSWIDSQGQEQQMLKLDDLRMQILRKLARNEPVSGKDLARSGVQAFLQQAGLNNSGSQLIILDR